MNTVQLGIRIPSSLNQRLTVFIAQTGMSKTEVVVSALASYLGCG
jgi:predicted DNA-binding protein